MSSDTDSDSEKKQEKKIEKEIEKEKKTTRLPMKAVFWLIAWLLAGVVGNFFSLGGEWELTRRQLVLFKGELNDFYPLQSVRYAGRNASGELLLCLGGRKMSPDTPPPSEPVSHAKLTNEPFALVFSPDTLSRASQALTPVYFENGRTNKANAIDRPVFFAYRSTDVRPGCDGSEEGQALKSAYPPLPLRWGLEPNSADTVPVQPPESATRIERLPAQTMVQAMVSLHHAAGSPADIRQRLADRLPEADRQAVFLLPWYMSHKIIVGKEPIEIWRFRGGGKGLLFLPPELTGQPDPIILVGGYQNYPDHLQGWAYLSSLAAIGLSAVMDVILQPLRMLYHLIVVLGFLALRPA